jgi:integrase
MLKLAERRRFIARTPFAEVEFLEERSMRRKPHIVTFDEEELILAVADPHIRTLTVLIMETGMRSNREALALKWDDIDS